MPGLPAAKMGDTIVGADIHILLIPSPPGAPVPTPTPMPFVGVILTGTSNNVLICGTPAAVVGSGAMNVPPHVPAGGPFQRPPDNQGKITAGSSTVMINGKPAARAGDMASTCTDAPTPPALVVAFGNVLIG